MSCPFCNPNQARIISESTRSIALFDSFPLTEGHALIVSKRHVANFFGLSPTEQVDMLTLMNQVKQLLDSRFGTKDYNVGINCGKNAGQTIGHSHIHLIPRRENDIDDPRGGVRWIFPDHAVYWE